MSANVEQMNKLMVDYDYPSNCKQGVRRRETALLFSSMYNDTNIRRDTLNKVCRSLFTAIVTRGIEVIPQGNCVPLHCESLQ